MMLTSILPAFICPRRFSCNSFLRAGSVSASMALYWAFKGESSARSSKYLAISLTGLKVDELLFPCLQLVLFVLVFMGTKIHYLSINSKENNGNEPGLL